jgi:hypothetical protein
MTQEQKEALEAVEKINNELYYKYSRKDSANFNYNNLDLMPIISITFADCYTFISLTIPSSKQMLPEIQLYHSENNDRIYYEKSDKMESFYKMIKRKFREIKEEIYSVKL